jgi:hypothetical protein
MLSWFRRREKQSKCGGVCYMGNTNRTIFNLITSWIRSCPMFSLEASRNIARSNTSKRSPHWIVHNRFTSRCFQPLRRLLHARWKSRNFNFESVGSWYWKRKGKWITRRFSLLVFVVFLEFLSGGIIRRISCNFTNNWLKCCVHKLLAKSISSPEKKRENIEQSKSVAKAKTSIWNVKPICGLLCNWRIIVLE